MATANFTTKPPMLDAKPSNTNHHDVSAMGYCQTEPGITIAADQGFNKLRHSQLTIRLYNRHDGHLSILNNRRIDRRYAPASKYRARVTKS